MTMLTKKNLYYGIALCLMTIPYLHSAASSSVPAKKEASTSYEELALAQLSIVNNSFKERELITPAEKRAFEAHFNTLPQQFRNDWLLWGIDKDSPFFIWTALENGATVNQDMLSRIERHIRETTNDNLHNWLRWGLENQHITIIREALQQGTQCIEIEEDTYDKFFNNLDIDLKNQTLIMVFNTMWAFEDKSFGLLLEAALAHGAYDNLICLGLAAKLATKPEIIKNSWLRMGCFYNAHYIVETALKLGADPNILDAQGKPLLFSYIDNPIIVRLLLSSKRANPNIHAFIPYGDGNAETTPLMHAILENGSLESIQLLLQYGAHVDERAASYTAAYCATIACAQEKNMTRLMSILELLIAHKANVDMPTHNGLTPLTNALHQRSSLAAKILIDAGCDIYVQSNGRTPLIRALEYLILFADLEDTAERETLFITDQTRYMEGLHEGACLNEDDHLNQNLLYIIALLVERGHQIVTKAQDRYSAGDPIINELQQQENANLTQALRLAGTNPTVRGIIENTKKRRSFIKKNTPIDIAYYAAERKKTFSQKTMRKFADKALLGNKLQRGVFPALRNREIARESGAKRGAFRYSEDSRPAAMCGFTPPLPEAIAHTYEPYKNLPTSGPLVTVLRGEEPLLTAPETSRTCRTLHLPSPSPVDPVRIAAALSHLPTRSAAAVRPPLPTDDDSSRSLALPNLTDLLPALSSSSSSSSASVDAATGSGGFLFPGHQDVSPLPAPASGSAASVAPSSSASTSSSSSSRASQKRTRQDDDSSETDTGTKRNKNDEGKEEERR